MADNGRAVGGVNIEKATVIGTRSRTTGGTIHRHTDSAQMHVKPEILVRMQDGRQKSLSGREFDGMWTDQELVLVWPAGGGDLLRFANLDTRQTHDYEGLNPQRGTWEVIKAALWKGLTIYLPVNLSVGFLAGQIGLSGGILGSIVGLGLNVLFFYCIYLGWRTAGERADERRELRTHVDAVFRKEGWIAH
jgi:hypothetical protein